MVLNKEKIIENLNSSTVDVLGQIHCLESVDSTNRWLADQANNNSVQACVCVADSQTNGIGRAGKPWFAEGSKNILMSIGFQFEVELIKLASLSLVTGIAIVNALERVGVSSLALKWPNDVYLNGAKLAGILIQTQKNLDGTNTAIIGIGLNLALSDDHKQQITQHVAELSAHGFGPDQREFVIAKVLDELFVCCELFSQHGLAYFLDRWHQLDYLKDQQVMLLQSDQRIEGRYIGINADGALRISLPNEQVKEYYVGDLSLRKNPDK